MESAAVKAYVSIPRLSKRNKKEPNKQKQAAKNKNKPQKNKNKPKH